MVDHSKGDMVIMIRMADHEPFDPMVFCVNCTLKFLHWSEGRD